MSSLRLARRHPFRQTALSATTEAALATSAFPGTRGQPAGRHEDTFGVPGRTLLSCGFQFQPRVTHGHADRERGSKTGKSLCVAMLPIVLHEFRGLCLGFSPTIQGERVFPLLKVSMLTATRVHLLYSEGTPRL